jgi:hypothetical protein
MVEIHNVLGREKLGGKESWNQMIREPRYDA